MRKAMFPMRYNHVTDALSGNLLLFVSTPRTPSGRTS
jgi:hypothetical protein